MAHFFTRYIYFTTVNCPELAKVFIHSVSYTKIYSGTSTGTEKISVRNPVSKGSIRKPIRKREDNIKIDFSNAHVVRI
jgi:hypothetical protein